MRSYSRQIPNNYIKFQSLPRNYTQQKRLQQLHTLKESEVKVGIYKYSTKDELGKGYSSKVYKGVQIEKIHKRYAIKVIQLKKFRGSNLEMLQAQIEIHKSLVHQNVLRLHQVIKTPYFYYLILEYCPHGNLHEYIKQKKKLSEANAVEIMEQVLAGFKYILQEGVIHRDMKPANILRIGNKWKISDFGFAVKSKYGFKDRINVGTPLYMSPQALKKSYYSTKGDIFAIGVIMYEMLMGHTPWQCSNQKELLQKIKTQITIPQTIRSPIIREFLIKTCQLNQNKRMSKQQLIQYQIRHAQTALSDSHNTKITERQSLIAISSISSRFQSRKPSIVAEPQQVVVSQDYIKYNNQILSNQFSFVRHLYSCLKNIDSFLLQSQSKQIFTLTLFKLLLRLIRFLCDKKTNFYNLKNWFEYLSAQSYTELYQQMILQSQTLQKQYLQQIKHNDIKIIRMVNRKFPDLCSSTPIAEKFYDSLRDYLTFVIRDHNHELMLLFLASQQKTLSSNQILQEKKEGEKDEKSLAASGGVRKIYESRRNSKRISEIKIDTPLFMSTHNPVDKLQKSQLEQNQKGVSQEALGSRQGQAEQSQSPQKQKIIDKGEPQIKSQTSITASATFNDKIQALQSLYTIYRASQLRCHSQDNQYGEKIKVLTDYNDSKLQRRDYLDLRRLLRSI